MPHNVPLAALLASLVLVWPAGSEARRRSPEEREARRTASAGYRHFEDQRYERAMRSFQRALKVIREPRLLWHLARSYEEMEELKNAALYYEELMAEFPDDEAAEAAQARLQEIRPRLAGSLFVDCGSARDVRLLMDGKRKACNELLVNVPPGVYVLEATARGKAKWTHQVRIPPSSWRRIRVHWRKASEEPEPPPPEVVEEEPEPRRPPEGVPWAAVTAAAAGAALLGVGGTFTLRGVWARQRFETMRSRGRVRASTIEGEVDRANEAFLTADVLYVTGAVGLVAGGVLWAVHGVGGPAPVAVPGGLLLTWGESW